MTLTGVRLVNFKCFADTGRIRLAPLTLIFGRNNAGKSSILQAFLLLRQTQEAPARVPRLNLRGPLYAAGQYGDLVHQHRASNEIEIGLSLASMENSAGDIELSFRSDEPQPPRLSRLRAHAHGAEPLEIRRGRGQGGPYELVIGGEKLGVERKANFHFSVDRLLPLIGAEPPRVGRPSDTRARSRRQAQLLLDGLEGLLRDLRAVGAFRRPPHRRYEYEGQASDLVDTVGENVVQALIEDATRPRHRSPGALFRSVNRWLRQIGKVRLMPLKRISPSARIFEVLVRDLDSGRWANFADVGFGIGQALPVIVEGLRTRPGGLFLVQEPEIHLHPDAQLAMGDFLFDLAATGRQVIVETHSEALLLRVRHRVVEAEHRRGTRFRRNGVSVIHVEAKKDGSSRAVELAIDSLGQMKDWPAGFATPAVLGSRASSAWPRRSTAERIRRARGTG